MERTLSDEDLMHRLSLGKLEVAAVLFNRYQIPLYNFFLRLNADRALSEDLTQTVFERLIRYRQSYVEGQNFRSWVYRIARNVRIDQVRKGHREYSTAHFEEGIAGTELPASRSLEEKEEQLKLRQALNQLEDDQRELLILARFQELKYREIADLLQITEGAVKVRVHRAIKELRDIYLKMERL